jgi:hypothetical protein
LLLCSDENLVSKTKNFVFFNATCTATARRERQHRSNRVAPHKLSIASQLSTVRPSRPPSPPPPSQLQPPPPPKMLGNASPSKRLSVAVVPGSGAGGAPPKTFSKSKSALNRVSPAPAIELEGQLSTQIDDEVDNINSGVPGAVTEGVLGGIERGGGGGGDGGAIGRPPSPMHMDRDGVPGKAKLKAKRRAQHSPTSSRPGTPVDGRQSPSIDNRSPSFNNEPRQYDSDSPAWGSTPVPGTSEGGGDNSNENQRGGAVPVESSLPVARKRLVSPLDPMK